MRTSTPSPSRRPGARSLVLLLWIAAATLYGAYALERWRSRRPTDFYLLWSVGQALATLPVDNVYTEPDRSAITRELAVRARASGSELRVAGALGWNRFEPISTPFLYSIFSLAASGDFDRDYRRFQMLSLAVYLATVFGISLALRLPPWLAFSAVVAATALYWPFYTDSGFANVGQLQVGLIGAYLLASRRDGAAVDVASGCVLGFLLLFKPTVVFAAGLLGGFWSLQRRWRKLARQALGASLMAGIGGYLPWTLFGGACTWSEWRRNAPAIFLTERYLGGGFLGKLFGPLPLWLYPLFAASVFAAVLVVIWRARAASGRPPESDSWRPAGGELTMVALGLAIFVVTAPVAHSHYFLLVVPLALLSIAPGRPLASRIAGGGAILLVALHPVWKWLGLTSGRNHSLWTFTGTWLLLLLVAYEFWRSSTAVRGDRSRADASVDPAPP
jgi:hypothetical protein